jgi:hypothetical protein
MINPFIYENDKDFKNLSQENVAKIDRWMKEFQEKKNLNKMDEKIILITGEGNSLKTSLAEYICKKYNLLSRMLNIQDSKINKDIKEFILQISNNKNVLNMIYKKIEDLCIIIDDFDTLLNNNDKSIITDFLTLFNVKKTNQPDFRLMYPIIVICQETGDKKICDLKKISCWIELDKLKTEDYAFYFNKILDVNKISFTKKQSEYLLQVLDQDIRKYNHILEDLLLIRKGKITDENIAFVVDTFSNKSGDNKINENLEKIFTEKISVKDNIDMYYSDKFLFSFLIHENYPYNIGLKIKNEDKVEFLAEVSENLAVNDVVQNLIFERQLWELNINSGLLTNVNTNFKHNEILSRNKGSKPDFKKRKYTTLLNKVSLYFTNRKVINQILHKYGNNNNDAFYLSEYLCDIIKLLDKKNLEEEMQKYLIPIVKKLELTSDDIDLLLRLNKLEEDDIKKIYTTKYKTMLKSL